MYDPLGSLSCVLPITTFDVPAGMHIGCLRSPTITRPAYPPNVFNFLLRCFPVPVWVFLLLPEFFPDLASLLFLHCS